MAKHGESIISDRFTFGHTDNSEISTFSTQSSRRSISHFLHTHTQTDTVIGRETQTDRNRQKDTLGQTDR